MCSYHLEQRRRQYTEAFFKKEGAVNEGLVILDRSQGHCFFQYKEAVDAACNCLVLEVNLSFEESSHDAAICCAHAFHCHNRYTSSADFNKALEDDFEEVMTAS